MSSFSNSADFENLVKEWLPRIDDQLKKEIPLFQKSDDPTWEKAITSAIFNGGKRTRPFLTILGFQSVSQKDLPQELVLKIAVAVEFIHSSSLVFDDLPSMDNATIRRGSQVLHLEFGEDKAILVALSLLLKGIELVIKTGDLLKSRQDSQLLVGDLMQSLGSAGLICGQWFDLSSKQSLTNQNSSLLALRNLKTMPLIRFALVAGATLGQATFEQKDVLAKFAELIGEAYQQIDDLLDLISDPYTLGKDTELDKKNDRLNNAYINLDKIVADTEEKLVQARTLIQKTNDKNLIKGHLISFTHYLNNRFQKALNFRSSLKSSR